MSDSNEEAESGPRIVSRRQDRREATSTPREQSGEETVSASMHLYEVTSTPAGCTKYEIGDYIELYVPDPPPQNITVQMTGACNGMTATLAE